MFDVLCHYLASFVSITYGVSYLASESVTSIQYSRKESHRSGAHLCMILNRVAFDGRNDLTSDLYKMTSIVAMPEPDRGNLSVNEQ